MIGDPKDKQSGDDPYKPKLPPRVRKPGEGHQYIAPMDGAPKMNRQLKAFNNQAPTDLTSQLAQKLRLVNEENENYKILLRRANEENKKLREQLEVQNVGQSGQSSSAQIQEYKQIIQEQQAYIRVLEKQVSGLESYLDSKGLAYVESDSESIPPPRDELERQNAEIRKQIDDLKNEAFKPPKKEELDMQIRKLNQLAGARMQYGKKQDNTYGFADRESIKVRFYKDGIYVNKGPFRPYEHDSVRRFMDDIMHGYLPSEWQDIYPDGVQIQAYYELDKEFVGETRNNDFQGKGQGINSIPTVPYPDQCAPADCKGNNYLDKQVSTMEEQIKKQTELDRQQIRGDLRFGVADNSNMVNAMDDKALQFRKMNVQEFLQKIPDKKIVKGKIISVRDQVAKDLGVGKKEQMVNLGKTILIERPDEAEMTRATLRLTINSPETKFHNKNIMVKVRLETPMSKIYEDVAQAIGVIPNQLQIMKMTGMILENCERTVEEYGIIHNTRAYCIVRGAAQ